MTGLLIGLGEVALVILQLLSIGLFIWIVMSWLFQFGVLNRGNQLVGVIHETLNRVFEPMLAPIRRFMPDLGGIDLSPIVLILGIIFFQNFIGYNLAAIKAGV